ncbi:MAG: hypothetical protein A2Z19_07020 [Deltaproteobacteria bacterium RBG_16_54_18]|nr:MAG: hypothetical protein A2Z19_07020 [Deltaproteobacteria bacterium RBG_16_54_18]
MRYVKLLFLLLIGAVALFFIFSIVIPEGPKIIIQYDRDAKETVYALADKSLSLTVYDTAGNEHILRLRSNSKLPLKEQVGILTRMLKKLPKERKFRSFFVGRLIEAFGADRTMSERLSLAASKSPLWEQAKGDPRIGSENKFVKEIANQAMIYPELKELFVRHGYEIQIANVEKVLIDPQTKLPYDCLTWFSLSRPLTPIGNGYWRDDAKVYWKWRTIEEPRGPIEYTVKEVKGADPKTFRFLAERVEGVWGKDRNGIYFFEQRIEGADISTWEPLDWGYSKDKNYVYKDVHIVTKADPKTFRVPEP